MFPIVHASRGDEKHLFDLTVKLGVPHRDVAVQALHELRLAISEDFPVKVLLQHSKVLQTALQLLSDSSSAVHSAVVAALRTVIARIRSTTALYQDRTLAASVASDAADSLQYPPALATPRQGDSEDLRAYQSNCSPGQLAHEVLAVCLPQLGRPDLVSDLIPLVLDALDLVHDADRCACVRAVLLV